MKRSALFLVLVSLMPQAFSQDEKQGLRKATLEEIKELVPKEVLNSAKEYSSKVTPFVEREVTNRNLLEKYSESKTVEEFLQTKEEFKQYYQKLVNEGHTKNSLIKISNNMNIDLYDNLLIRNEGIEKEIRNSIAEKMLIIEDLYSDHLIKWNLSLEEFDNLSESKRQEYLKDSKRIKNEDKKITEEIKTKLSLSKNLKEGELEAKNFQNMLKEVVGEVDYSKLGSVKTQVKEPQASKVQVFVPTNFSLESYKLNANKLNGNISLLTDHGKALPLCYRKTTSGNDMTLFLNDGQDVLTELSQKEAKNFKGKIYFSWGYNRAWHTNSDATFSTSEGTFTIHDAHGDDRPTKFDPKIYFNPTKMSIPQYNLKLGYEFNDKWGIEIGTDHMKWVFDNQRKYEITGDFDGQVVIDNPNSQHGWDAVHAVDFDEVKESGDVTWLGFEHTDGYNYAHVTGVYNQKLYQTKKKVFSLDARFGAGIGVMVPKTKVMMHRDEAWNWQGVDNKFHVAGGGAHADVRLKMTFFDRVFIQGVARGNAVKIQNALVDGERDPGARLEHSPIYSGQLSVEIGASFPINKKKKIKAKKF